MVFVLNDYQSNMKTGNYLVTKRLTGIHHVWNYIAQEHTVINIAASGYHTYFLEVIS